MKLYSLALILRLLLAGAAFADEEQPSDAGSVLVTTIAPQQGSLRQPVNAFGTVQPAPAGAAVVASLHAAQVMNLRVVQGQSVQKGEPLLDLGAEPSAVLAYAQAKSDLDLAQAELARTRELVKQRLATSSQLDQAQKAVRDAEATLKAREREGGGQAVETIASPISGVVSTLAVSNGDHVQPGATLIDLARSDALVGLLGVTPDEQIRLKPGQSVALVDLDRPDAPIAAKLASVGGMADPKTGLFTVVAMPADAGSGKLVAGAHLRAKIDTDPVNGWIVPRDAVLSDDKGPYVFQVAGGKAVRVGVSIVGGSEDQLAIAGQLDPAKKIVVAGNYQLSDGMAVREAESTPASNGGQQAARESEGEKADAGKPSEGDGK
jgi:RND family efflux transporter MFP subunit